MSCTTEKMEACVLLTWARHVRPVQDSTELTEPLNWMFRLTQDLLIFIQLASRSAVKKKHRFFLVCVFVSECVSASSVRQIGSMWGKIQEHDHRFSENGWHDRLQLVNILACAFCIFEIKKCGSKYRSLYEVYRFFKWHKFQNKSGLHAKQSADMFGSKADSGVGYFLSLLLK